MTTLTLLAASLGVLAIYVFAVSSIFSRKTRRQHPAVIRHHRHPNVRG